MGEFIKNVGNYFHKRKQNKLKYAAGKLIQQVNDENVNKKLHDWRFTEKSSRDHRCRTPFNTPLTGEFSYNLHTINRLNNCSHLNDHEFQKILHLVHLEVFLRTEEGIEETFEKEFKMPKVKSESSIRCPNKSSSKPCSEGTPRSSKGLMPKQAMESKSLLNPNATSKSNTVDSESLNHNEIYLPKILANFAKENDRPTSCQIEHVSENNNAGANLLRCRYSTNEKEKRTVEENFNSQSERIILSPSNNAHFNSNEDSTELLIAHRISAGYDNDASKQQNSAFQAGSSGKDIEKSEAMEAESSKKTVQIPKAVATTNLKESPKSIHAKSRDQYGRESDSGMIHDENRSIACTRISIASDEDTLDVISVRNYDSSKNNSVEESQPASPGCCGSRRCSTAGCSCNNTHCCKFSPKSQKPADSNSTNEGKRLCGCGNHVNTSGQDELK